MSEILSLIPEELNQLVRTANRMGRDNIKINGVTIIPPTTSTEADIKIAWNIEYSPLNATEDF